MTTSSDLWTPHLNPGESLVWSASVSPALVKASRNRKRMIAAITGLAAAILAALLTFRALESFFPPAPPPPGSMNVFGPVYVAVGIAMAIYAFSRFTRLSPPQPATVHFGATAARLIALGPTGAVVETLHTADIDDVRTVEITRPPYLVVSRRDDEHNQHAFIIEFIDRPLEAKAIIEDLIVSEPPPAAPEAEPA